VLLFAFLIGVAGVEPLVGVGPNGFEHHKAGRTARLVAALQQALFDQGAQGIEGLLGIAASDSFGIFKRKTAQKDATFGK
jgi:hypothetical protein